MCMTLFLKRQKVFMQRQPPEGFFKKDMKNFAEFTRKHISETLF